MLPGYSRIFYSSSLAVALWCKQVCMLCETCMCALYTHTVAAGPQDQGAGPDQVGVELSEFFPKQSTCKGSGDGEGESTQHPG